MPQEGRSRLAFALRETLEAGEKLAVGEPSRYRTRAHFFRPLEEAIHRGIQRPTVSIRFLHGTCPASRRPILRDPAAMPACHDGGTAFGSSPPLTSIMN